MSVWVWLLIAAIVVIAVIAVIVVARSANSRKRTKRLKERFGPEYERTLAETGEPRAKDGGTSSTSSRCRPRRARSTPQAGARCRPRLSTIRRAQWAMQTAS